MSKCILGIEQSCDECRMCQQDNQKKWINVSEQLPPEDIIVETKIDDSRGCRNEQKLKRRGNLWFLPNGGIYVYYTPTHWRVNE